MSQDPTPTFFSSFSYFVSASLCPLSTDLYTSIGHSSSALFLLYSSLTRPQGRCAREPTYCSNKVTRIQFNFAKIVFLLIRRIVGFASKLNLKSEMLFCFSVCARYLSSSHASREWEKDQFYISNRGSLARSPLSLSFTGGVCLVRPS